MKTNCQPAWKVLHFRKSAVQSTYLFDDVFMKPTTVMYIGADILAVLPVLRA